MDVIDAPAPQPPALPEMEHNMNIEARARDATEFAASPAGSDPRAFWTETRTSRLSALWSQGVSAAGIAKALGDVSRSAVLGKLHRLRLLKSRAAASAPRALGGAPASGEPAVGCTPSLGRRTEPPHPARSPWRAEAFRPLAGSEPRPWVVREAGECAFPVGGDGEAVASCCAPSRARSAYCAAHHAIVFRKPPAPPEPPAEITPSGPSAATGWDVLEEAAR
jgi:GcrA cell cycle regulator